MQEVKNLDNFSKDYMDVREYIKIIEKDLKINRLYITNIRELYSEMKKVKNEEIALDGDENGNYSKKEENIEDILKYINENESEIKIGKILEQKGNKNKKKVEKKKKKKKNKEIDFEELNVNIQRDSVEKDLEDFKRSLSDNSINAKYVRYL